MSRVNGQLVELFLVRRGGGRSGKPAGLITRIDGKARQYIDFEFEAGGKRPSKVRIVQLDEKGRLQADVTTDVRQVNLRGSLSVSQQTELRSAFSRLLNGVQDLVLPDQLQAQTTAQDPCGDIERGLVAAGIAAVGAIAWSAFLAGTCAEILITCGAFIEASIAAATASALVIYLASEYMDCLERQPPPCDDTFEINECGGTGSGTGTGGGGDGSGGTGGTGGGTGGTGSGGGGFVCQWYTEWGIDPDGVHYTYSWQECHAI